MKYLFAIIIWFSIGIGVVAANQEKYGKPDPEKAILFTLIICWPAIVAAEIFRITFPKEAA